ncbi:hypothetical protein BS47DRAFT_819211 [Hydnum rufescens UP504]|uniref:Uncharacterized protein n=1 Tax=Hydnum rufescens UP504 TaxID=1448309 RepID=A0A9P6AZQ7_9AGAM|nr:hypothetical protein BS47DRAFT_819211 [Hydnum rufescens UP504]
MLQPNFIFLVMGNSSEGQTTRLYQVPDTSALSAQWTADVSVGEIVFFLLSDGAGMTMKSDNVVISNSSVAQSPIPRVTATSVFGSSAIPLLAPSGQLPRPPLQLARRPCPHLLRVLSRLQVQVSPLPHSQSPAPFIHPAEIMIPCLQASRTTLPHS